MRNLKRVLSLALASVMLLGMMVIGAGAADTKYGDLTDKDQIKNTEAVSLMVDLGIIVGKPDGSFAPSETVDRATMAKLITYIVMGDVDPALFEGTTTDLKDIDGQWAEGYIKYCYANNIITGDGQGHFFPTKGVSVAEAAKMLLVAIGYDATAQGYVGPSWSVNIMRDAKLAGLLDGISATATSDLTRDNAAQMVFNALNTRTITYTTQYDGGVAYKVDPTTTPNGTPNPTLGQMQYSLTPVSGVLTANEANSGAAMAGKSKIGTTTLNIASSIEDIGKKVVYYTFTKDGKTVNSSTAFVDEDVKTVAVPDNLKVSSPASNEKLVSTWLTENGLREVASPSTTASYVNYYAASPISNGSLATSLAAVNSGDTAYVIDNDGDGVIDALVVNSLTVKTVTGDVKTATSGSTETVYVPGVLTGYTNAANVTGYEGLVKGDVVMTMTVNGTVTYITKAQSITGTITGYKASPATIYVDGTAYSVSSLSNAMSYNDIKALGTTSKATFWLDAEGKLIYGKSESAVATSSLAIVVGYAAGGNNGISDVAASARLLFLDGTTEVVDVAKNSTYTNASFDATNVDTFGYVAYTVNDNGQYVLTNATGVSGKISNKSITTGVANNVMGTYAANADTVFIVASTSPSGTISYTAYKGIANAPSYNGTATGYVVSENNIAKLVFITSGTQVSSGSADYLYTNNYANATYNAVDKTWTIEAYVNGVKKDVAVKSSVYSTTLNADGLYKVDMDDSGVVTGATAQTWTLSNKKGVSYSAGTVTVGSTDATTNYYTVNDSTVVFVKDGTTLTTITPDSILADTNDTVSVVANAKGVAEVIEITKVAMDDMAASSFTNLKAVVTAIKLGTNTEAATAITNAGTQSAETIAVNPDAFTENVAVNSYLGVEITVANQKNVTVKATLGSESGSVTSLNSSTDTIELAVKRATGVDDATLTITVTDGDTEYVYTSVIDMSAGD